MANDEEENAPVLEISPGDVRVSDEGAVEVISTRLAELVKASLRIEGEDAEGSRALRPPSSLADDHNNGCGNNVYKCGQAEALLKPVRLRVL